MSEERKMAVYVVQQQGAEHWTDIATVEVPSRTKRWTVIEAALRQAGLSPESGPVFVRVLDADAARVDAVVPEVPAAPRWKLAPTAVEGVVDAVAEHLGLDGLSGTSAQRGQ